MQVPGAATVTHHVRVASQIAPGRPAIWLGLRTAFVIAAPLLLASWLDPVVATWSSLAGYSIALVDKGGAYRARAEAMGYVSLGSLVAVVVGTLVAGHPVLTVLVVTAGTTACAFGQAWGPQRASIGNTIAIHLVVAAFLPLGGRIAPALLGVAGGAAWAMLLALVVWPVRVYKPGRRALSATLHALAEYAAALAATPLGTPGARDPLARFHRETRSRLEVARETLVVTRRGRRGETGRGERLLSIAHACDHAFGGLIALEELLDVGGEDVTTPAVPAQAALLDSLAGALRDLAERVLLEEKRAAATGIPAEIAGDPSLRAGRITATAATPTTASPASSPAWTAAHAEHIRMTLARILRDQRRIEALIDSLADDSQPASVDGLEDAGQSARLAIAVDEDADAVAPGIWERVHAELALDSAIFRHAMRVAICVGLSSAIAAYYQLARGYWIVITVFILLQPVRALTTQRAIQRGLGTIAGAVLAAAIAWAVRDPHILIALIIVMAGIGASVLALNYALYALFLTPTFVLLAEVHTQDFTIVRVRVMYTLLAGAIAFLASAVLWPAREQAHFSDRMAGALRAASYYLDTVGDAVAGSAPLPAASAIAARRAFGVAVNNAELALDRVVADRAPASVIEPYMSLVSAARRLGSAITVLGSSRAISPAIAREANLAAAIHAAGLRLVELAAAVGAQTLPPSAAAPAVALTDPLTAARWARVESQLASLAQATTRAGLDGDRAISTPLPADPG